MINLEPLISTPDFTPSIIDKPLSCAVIGNSNSLLEHEFGNEIDQHDIVFRCNQAPVQDYESHVGSKLTYRMMNSHNFWATKRDWPSRQSMCDKHAQFDPDFLTKIQDETIIVKRDVPPTEFPLLLDQMETNRNKVLFLNMKFHNLCDSYIGRSATSGFVSIMLAIKNFGKVNCFGFRFIEGEYHHYYERIEQYDQSCHHFTKEQEIMEWLNQTGHIILK